MVTYHLLFNNSPRWFSKVLKRGYSHVSCVRRISEDVAIEINAGNHLIVDISSPYSIGIGCNILKIELNYADSKKLWWQFMFWRWGIFNCVLITKYMLGIKSWSITPYQLFKLLHKGKYANKNKHITNVEVII